MTVVAPAADVSNEIDLVGAAKVNSLLPVSRA